MHRHNYSYQFWTRFLWHNIIQNPRLDEPGINRSSSGSSHGSGRASHFYKKEKQTKLPFYTLKKQQLQFHCSFLALRLFFKPLLRRALSHLKPKFGTSVTVSRLARKCSCNVVIQAMQTFRSVYPPRVGLGFQQPADGRQELECWQYLSQPQIFVSLTFQFICLEFTCKFAKQQCLSRFVKFW